MKKSFAFLAVALVAIGLATGCSGFKGFCDRGSLFPTRQPQLTPTQTMYTGYSDVCCPTEGVVISGACDPCASGMTSANGLYSAPVVGY